MVKLYICISITQILIESVKANIVISKNVNMDNNRYETAKPVTIISGFLGAGKTTFLNEYIVSRKGIRPFIIENELGEEGIDAGLIVAPGTDVFELNNGCLCCSLNEDLFDLLDALWKRNDEFDELIIETTGIADPATIAQPFLVYPEIEECYKLERVICIVDAQQIDFQLEETEEARKQIAFADIILINKGDTVRKGHLFELEELLRHINPFATILSGDKESGYPLEKIMAFNRDDFDGKIPPSGATGKDGHDHPILHPVAHADVEDHSHSHSHSHPDTHPHHEEFHHHNISSLSFVFDRPFNLDRFGHRLMMFLNIQAKNIYRVKGFIWANDEPQKVIVQSVSNMLAITMGERWLPEEMPKSRLVFIGKDLASQGLEKMLAQCLDKDFIYP
ncbi:GTPase, G3E family [Porphyromonadaceae bacterium KH3CP3RA]|nr:GTPase, G3E family [Porphyromonadaceae bacterium KH3CP3RA]